MPQHQFRTDTSVCLHYKGDAGRYAEEICETELIVTEYDS